MRTWPACATSPSGWARVAGYVLYTGQQTLPFGDRLRALPIDALWNSGGVLAPERHVVHAARDAAVGRLGEPDLLLPQIAERPRRQLLAAEFPPDEAGDQLARGTQRGCRHIGLEDREQRRRVGQQQARAPVEPQQVRVPVLGIRRRRRPRRPPSPGQAGAFSCTAGSLCDRTACSREQVARFFRSPCARLRAVASRPVRNNPNLCYRTNLLLAPVTPARSPAQARHPGGTPIQPERLVAAPGERVRATARKGFPP